MGSGGRVVADSRLRTMMFSTPSHTLERLFSVLLANKPMCQIRYRLF